VTHEPGSLRPLTFDEHACLLWVLSAIEDRGAAEALYLQSLTVHALRAESPCMVDLVAGETPGLASTPDGLLPIRAVAYEANETLIGEVLVWVELGRLSCLEFGWVTETRPDHFPRADLLRHVQKR
jgi:hypothetical protein